MLKDGVILYDHDNKIVFNQYSFCELMKHLLSYYVHISYAEASEIVDHSSFAKPVSDIMDASLLAHEYTYYWSMILYYGNVYWEKGIPAEPDDLTAYFRLENSIMKQYNLNEPFE